MRAGGADEDGVGAAATLAAGLADELPLKMLRRAERSIAGRLVMVQRRGAALRLASLS